MGRLVVLALEDVELKGEETGLAFAFQDNLLKALCRCHYWQPQTRPSRTCRDRVLFRFMTHFWGE